MDPWVQPIYQNMFTLYDKVKIEKLIAQNVTHEQMEMIVTRLGVRSKMIICGDDHQVDLKSKRDSGFKFLYTAARKVKKMVGVTLLTNHRDPIVDDLLDLYEEAEEKGITNGNGKRK